MKKLVLNQETLRALTANEVDSVFGGRITNISCQTCNTNLTCGTSCIGTCPPPVF